MIRGARERNKEEGKLVIPKVRVDPRFRQYWKRVNYPNDVPSLYGTHYDTEWHFDESTHDWVPAEERPLRVMGAANWSDVWPEWPDVGNQYTLLGTQDQPLVPIQIEMMEEHCDIKVKFERRLGGGLMGTVYKVKCQMRVYEPQESDKPSSSQGPSTSQSKPDVWGPDWDAACKVMRLSNPGNKQKLKYRVDRLLHDFLSLRYLQHENIVQMLDMVTIPDSGTHFPYSTVLLLMEVCDGDLIHIYGKCTNLVPHVIVKKMMRDVCAGLQYMHKENAVHLDIKPDNILFKWNPPGNPLTEANLLQYTDTLTFKLGDLGFCMTFNPNEPVVTKRDFGTPLYMSLEMKALRNNTRQDAVEAKPCDIYSLGVTLAFCVMDFFLHKDYAQRDALFDYMAQLAQSTPEQCPHGMTPLLASLIQSDPKERPTIEAVLNHEWLRE